MTEKRNIPATKGEAKATLMASQVETWEAAGWVVDKPKKAKADKSNAPSKTITQKN